MSLSKDFFNTLKKDVAVSAAAFNIYSIEAFISEYIHELIEIGDLPDFQLCENTNHVGSKGAYIHGFNIDTNDNTEAVTLNLIVTDYDQRLYLETLTQTEASLWFKRLLKFFKESYSNEFYDKLDPSTEVYRLSEYIDVYKDSIEEVNLFFLSERQISSSFKEIKREDFEGINIKYHLWDISRLEKLRASNLSREALEIDFVKNYQSPLDCLHAHLGDTALPSYLVICPGDILADLYNDYGARLLEQNVRSFLQAKGGVNKGIRNTILHEPEYFFSYNNGITATASDIEIIYKEGRSCISRIVDLQIVNGGQTTASLAKAKIKDKADLSKIFVQMKLTIVSDSQSEKIIPKISEYANTQNKVNVSDLSANHPYHIKIEELSRKLWAPPTKTVLRDSGWFYERSRGQYNEMLASGNRNLLKIKYPKTQLFTKTDLAKYMMIWDSPEPKWVNMGAQKNFAKFSEYISKNWKKMEAEGKVNDYYFKKIVARAIIFKQTEKLVSAQEWYTNGYRANIVIYTLAYLSYFLKKNSKKIDYLRMWKEQCLSANFEKVLVELTREINNILTSPNQARTTNNTSEWAKKDACWGTIIAESQKLDTFITSEFIKELIDKEKAELIVDEANHKQKIADAISIQNKINSIDKYFWRDFLQYLEKEHQVGFKEKGILKAAGLKVKDLSSKQCFVLERLLEQHGGEFEKIQSYGKLSLHDY